MRTFYVFLAILVCFLSLSGCRIIGNYSDDETVLERPASDFRTIKGSIYEDDSELPAGMRAVSEVRFAKKVEGIKVFSPYDPENYALTDAEGKFVLLVDLVRFKTWKQANDIPSGDNDETTIALVAEVAIVQPDGNVIKKKTSMVVSVGSDDIVDLDEKFDSQNNQKFLVRFVGNSRLTCRMAGKPAANTQILLYDPVYGSPLFYDYTDDQGAIEFEFAPGMYRLVVTVSGKKPFVYNNYFINAGQDTQLVLDIPDIPASYGLADPDSSRELPVFSSSATAPRITVYADNQLLSNGSVIARSLNSQINFRLGVLDDDSGLGSLSGTINGRELFTTLEANGQSFLNHDVTHRFTVPGTFTISLSASDLDRQDSFTPVSSAYVRVKVLRATIQPFNHKVGIIINNQQGENIFNGLIVDDADFTESVAEIQVNPGDQVIPYIHVTTGSNSVSGQSNNYKQILNVPDAGNNAPVAIVRRNDAQGFRISFEECRSSHAWYDYDYDDCIIDLDFVEAHTAGAAVVAARSFPTHRIDMTFKVYVSPIIVTPGKISGHIVDETSGKPIGGAVVAIDGTNIVTLSDTDGYFELLNVVPGTYNLVAISDGYQVRTFPGIIVPDSK